MTTPDPALTHSGAAPGGTTIPSTPVGGPPGRPTAGGGPTPGAAATEERDVRDIRERGMSPRGEVLYGNRRLFMQLQVMTGATQTAPLVAALEAARDAHGVESVLYADVSDPRGVGLLTFSEDPAVFTGPARTLLNGGAFASLTLRPEMAMIGRTYSTGRETDLDHWLVHRPRANALHPDWPWVVWYPLRRKGEFNLLPADDQRAMMKEHAGIGYLFGEADHAHDIRLACHGLDRADNDFVIGLLGRELYPLSRCVQEMRRTRQTGAYMDQMGPFFVGRVIGQFGKSGPTP